MSNFMDIIKTRRTIRRFKKDRVEKDKLSTIAQAGNLAATAGNKQPWEFIVIDSSKTISHILPYLSWLGGAPSKEKHPTALIALVLDNPGKRWAQYADCGAVFQNMMLSAWEMGIGSCWIGSIKREEVSLILGIPENLHLFSILALGYPDEKPLIINATDDLKPFRSDGGVLHIPKRSVKEVMYFNKYESRG